MTQKDKMLRMVLDAPKLREAYDYAPDDYDSWKNSIVPELCKCIYLNNNLLV